MEISITKYGHCAQIKMFKHCLKKEGMCKIVYTKRTPHDGMYDTIILMGVRGKGYTKKIYEFSKYCLVLFLDEYIYMDAVLCL